LSLTDGPVTIVGVLPPGVQLARWANLYLPFAAMPPSLRAAVALRGNHADSQVLGRLAPGVSLERARAAMRVVARRLASAYPEEQEGWEQVEIVPIRDFLTNPSSMSAGPASLSGQTVVLFGSA